MKKYLFSFLCFLCFFSSFSQVQELWSTGSGGGEYGKGAVFKVDSAGGDFEIIHSFKSFNGFRPKNNKLVDLNDGFLYGVTGGSIFKINKLTKEINHLTNIFSPTGSFTLTSDGRLIGMDLDNRTGLIFEYKPIENKYDTLFKLPNDEFQGNLVEVSPNKFIASTFNGGQFNDGNIFEYDIVNNTLRNLLDLNLSRTEIKGSFMKASNGKFYGAFGNLIEYDPVLDTFIMKISNYGITASEFVELDSSWLYTTIGNKLSRYNYHTNIHETMAQFPSIGSGEGGIIQAKNNKIYFGRAYQIYEYDLLLDSLSIVKSFSASNEPQVLNSFFHELDSGEMISFSGYGGRKDLGTLFSYNYLTNEVEVLNEFQYSYEGENPFVLTAAENEKVYGITQLGGRYNQGTVFQISPNNSNFSKLLDVGQGFDFKSVNLFNDSVLLLVTEEAFVPSGINTRVFKYNMKSSLLDLVHLFDSAQGYNITGELVSLDGQNFFGKTENGGSNSAGTIFKFNAQQDSLEVVHHFASGSSGAGPSGITFLNDSILIGNVEYSLLYPRGYMFEFNIISKTIHVIFDFNNTSSPVTANPIFPIKIFGNSILGITNDGSINGNGALFKFDYIAKQYTTLYKFKYGQNFRDNPNPGVYLNSKNEIIGSYSGGGYKNGSRHNSAVYKFTTVSNLIQISHEGDFTYDNVNSINSPLVPINVCRNSVIEYVDQDSISICSNVSLLNLVSVKAKLNSSTNWKFYNSFGEAFTNSNIAEFDFIPTRSGFYYIESEGGCVQNHVKDSVYVTVMPDVAYFIYDTLTVCKNSEYISTKGDTIKQLTRTTLFSDLNQSSSGCDSNLYTLVNVIPRTDVIDSLGYLISNQLGAVYQWLNCANNESILGETKRIFSPKKRGIYKVEVIFNGCAALSACIQADAVGLQENSLQSQLNYYPNPTNGIVQIEFAKKQRLTAVEVYTIQGKLVQTESFTNQNSFELNLNQISGIYFIQLTNEKGDRANLKIVKR